MSDAAEALEAQRRKVTQLEAELGPHHPNVALQTFNLALHYYARGRDDDHEVERLLLRAIDIFDLLPDDGRQANVMEFLGDFYFKRGRDTEAERFYRRSLELGQRLDPSYCDGIEASYNLGVICRRQDRIAEAAECYDRSADFARQHLGANHPDVGFYLRAAADAYLDLERYDEAEKRYRQAIEQLLAPRDDGVPQFPALLEILEQLVVLCIRTGRREEARQWQVEGTGLTADFRKFAPEPHRQVCAATVTMAMKRPRDTRRLYEEVLAYFDKYYGREFDQPKQIQFGIAQLDREFGELDRAETAFQEIRKYWEDKYGPRHPELSRVCCELARIYALRQQIDKARAEQQRAEAIWRQANFLTPAAAALGLCGIAASFRAQEDYDQAYRLYERALTKLEKEDPQNLLIAGLYQDLAWIRELQNRPAEAAKLDDHGESIKSPQSLLKEPCQAARICVDVGQSMIDILQHADARPWLEQALEFLKDCPTATEADWAEVLLPLSQLDCRDNRYEDALPRAARAFAYYDQQEQRDTKRWKFALLIQAEAYAELGQCDEAEAAALRWLEFVSQHDPDAKHHQYKGLKVLADVYRQQRQYETALTVCQRVVEALEQEPMWPKLDYCQIEIASALKSQVELLELLDRSEEIPPIAKRAGEIITRLRSERKKRTSS